MTTDRELLDAIEAVDLLRQAAAMAAPALEVLRQEAAAKGVPTADLYRRIGVRGPIVEWCQQQEGILRRKERDLVPLALNDGETVRRDTAEVGVLPAVDTDSG